MKIAITGATGFIGGHLLERLIKDGHECIGLDDLSINEFRRPAWITENGIYKKAKLVLGYDADCANIWNVFKELKDFGPDVIFNLAVKPLPQALMYPYDNFMTNVKITMNVLDFIREHSKNTKLVQFSSSEVYGSAQNVLMDENHPIMPNTPYAAAKAACDAAVRSYVVTYGINAVTVRPFNTIGPRQNDKSYAAIIPKTAKRIVEGKKPVIYGKGMNTRDYTAVEDVVNGAIEAMEHGHVGETYNICTGKETSVVEMMNLISNQMQYYGEFDYKTERPGDVMRHCGDNRKAKRELGWEPEVDIEEAVRRAIWE